MKDLPFQLNVFRNTLFHLEPILPFLNQQTQLRVYRNMGGSSLPLPDHFLPSVTDAAIPLWAVQHFISHPLTTLETVLGGTELSRSTELQFISTLSSFRSTLTTLVLHRRIVNE